MQKVDKLERGRLILRKKACFFIIMIFIAVCLNGCAGEVKKEEDAVYRVAAILPENNKIRVTDFWQEVWSGVHEATDLYEIALSEYSSDGGNGIAERFQMALLAKGDGIILFTSDSSNEELLDLAKTARESGVRIVIVDTEIDETYYDAFVGIDNEAAGRQLAEYLYEHYREGEQIVLLDVNASGAVSRRRQAFLAFLEEKGIQKEIHSVSLREENEERILDIQEGIEETEDLRWLVSFDPSCTIQAAEVLHRLKLASEISLIGFGESDSAEAYVEDKTITALLVQDNYSIGALAVEKMKKILDGEELTEKRYYVDSTLRTCEGGDPTQQTEERTR